MRRFRPLISHCPVRLGALAALLALSGCSQTSDSAVKVQVIGASTSPFEQGARLSPAAQLVRSATAEGLVGFDAEGRIIPALADRWIVTDDGQSYIFRLRDGTWPDTTPLSGETAAQSLRQAISTLQGTPLAQDLSSIGEIRAMAGRVVEIRLSQPMPDLLQILAQPELGLVRKDKGTGPMALTRRGKLALLTPIAPERRGLPAIEGWQDTMRPVSLTASSAAKAVSAFDQGAAELVLGGRIEDFPRASQTGLTRAAIRMDAVTGLFGLLVLHDDGFLGVAANREALAMAVDRDALMAAFGLSGWAPSTRLVPGGVSDAATAGAERWSDLSMAQRQAQAKAQVERWTAGKPPPDLRLDLPEGPGGDILFDRLSADMQAIGIKAVRVRGAGDADLRMLDVVARYPRVSWFLNQLSCASLRGPCSSKADLLVAAVPATAEPAGKAVLLERAQEQLEAANVFIPFGAPVRWSLVSGGVSGFSANRWGLHPLMPMATRPK
jgi:peptide/nickel transport system substrate-binding protein/oligopeptide transport system substrate-binding protein